MAALAQAHAGDPRILVLGDSLSAGYGAIPQTRGFAYRLYQQGVFDVANKTIFSNSSVPGATSGDVLAYQVPQAFIFKPEVITITEEVSEPQPCTSLTITS